METTERSSAYLDGEPVRVLEVCRSVIEDSHELLDDVRERLLSNIDKAIARLRRAL